MEITHEQNEYKKNQKNFMFNRMKINQISNEDRKKI